ncbi:hypothetical protein POTG_01762 [Paenibacillus sp. oral taxon 786 str. D14]|nr:hypothetical protein POTG_01762 [Paenibacillus sp. oral taxon 786 str. D14]
MKGLTVFQDTRGNVYVSAERARNLHKLCDRLGRGRNTIRWNSDLRCYVIVLSTKQGKEVARAFSKSLTKTSKEGCG